MGVKGHDEGRSDTGVPVEIDSLASDGRGVGRADGLVWFVEGAMPGDRVIARPVRRRPRFVEAEVEARQRDGPERRVPPCPLQGVCGGCPWMVLDEAVQRTWKRTVVRDAITRIAGVKKPPITEPLASPASLRYRNKVEFSLGGGSNGGRAAGLRAVGGAHVVDVERCLMQSEPAERAWTAARAILTSEATLECWWDRAEPLRIVVRSSSVDGRVVVALRCSGELPGEALFAARLLAEAPDVSGVVRVEAVPGRRGGGRERTLAGEGRLTERWLGTTFRLPASAFFQVNPGAAEVLGERVLEACGPAAGRRVVDLFGGVGAYGWALSRGGDRTTVVEASREAVRCGRKADGGAGVRTPRFVPQDVADWALDPGALHGVDLVVANPPRTGLPRGVAEIIARGAASRVVLVSCDPATLARDLRPFLIEGYRLERVEPVDLFPQTAHIETVSVLAR